MLGEDEKKDKKSEGHPGLYNSCQTRKPSIQQGNRNHDRDDDHSFPLFYHGISDAHY